MNKQIIFNFNDGLKGNLQNKFDFEVLFEINTLSEELLDSQVKDMNDISDKQITINLKDFKNKDGKVIIKITQKKDIYSNVNDFEVDVDKSLTVNEVIVNPSTISVAKGGTQLFTATVNGEDGVSPDVIWTIHNNSINTNLSPTTSNSTILTIDTDETATSLTITATSIEDNTKFVTSFVNVIDDVLPDSILNRKVLIIDFNPILVTKDNIRFNQLISAKPTAEIAELTKNRLERAARGKVKYQLIYEPVVNEFPRLIGKDPNNKSNTSYTFQFTEQEFLKRWDLKGDKWLYESDVWNMLHEGFPLDIWWETNGFTFDYNYYIDKFNLIQRRNNDEFHEVWIAGDFEQQFEDMMVGKGAYYTNGVPFEKDCKPFRITQITKLRYDLVIHNMGHGGEGILGNIFNTGSWGLHGKDPIPDENLWTTYDRYTIYNKLIPGQASVGNIHYPPNAETDYDVNNTQKVLSMWKDWHDNYPNLTGVKELTGREPWYIEGAADFKDGNYCEWWFTNWPNSDGRDEKGYSHNWWNYYCNLVYTDSLELTNVGGNIQVIATLNTGEEIDVSQDCVLITADNIITAWRDGVSATITI